MPLKNRTIVIFILGLLSALGPFSIDMYLPGFPSIAADLHSSIDKVAYSLSSFFIGVCTGQLVGGPLLDRFGRKKPLYIGLTIYIVASLGCAMSHSVENLIMLRFVQALGGCVAMIAPSAIVRDVFPVNEIAKVFSLLILILGISPILAPTIGSFLITAYGWNWVFVILACIALLLLLAVRFILPETKVPDNSISLKPVPIITGYATVIKHSQFFTYAFGGAIAAAGLFAYLAGSPIVFMQMYKVTEQQYGWIFGLIAAGLIISSQFNNVLLKKYDSAQIMKFVLKIQSLLGLVLCIGVYFNVLNLYSTIALMFLFLSCQGFSFPNSAALSLAPFEKEAGSAAALMGALQMSFGALATALIGIINNGTALPLVAVMAACALLGLVIVSFGSKHIPIKAKLEDVEEQAFEQIERY